MFRRLLWASLGLLGAVISPIFLVPLLLNCRTFQDHLRFGLLLSIVSASNWVILWLFVNIGPELNETIRYIVFVQSEYQNISSMFTTDFVLMLFGPSYMYLIAEGESEARSVKEEDLCRS